MKLINYPPLDHLLEAIAAVANAPDIPPALKKILRTELLTFVKTAELQLIITHSALGQEELLTRKEAADYLGVTVGTLSTWGCTKRRELPIVRIGRPALYRLSDLKNYVANKMRAKA